MKYSYREILLFFLMVLPVSAAASEQLVIANNGTVRMDPLMGSVSWTGSISFQHHGQLIDIDGRATLFSGPSIHQKQGGDESVPLSEFVVKHEWISLVALGNITITGESGKSVKAKHLVCIADGGRILADGKVYCGGEK